MPAIAVARSMNWRETLAQFLVAYAIALLLHVVVVAVWTGWLAEPAPKAKSFQTLKIKLGKAQPVVSSVEGAQVAADNDEAYIAPIFPDQPVTLQEKKQYIEKHHEQKRREEAQKSAPKHALKLKDSPLVAWKAPSVTAARTSPAATPSSLPPVLQRLATPTGTAPATAPAPAPALAAGVPMGNSSAENAAQLQRYTQLLSLWFDKHKHYPATARQSGQEGQGEFMVVIDREGNILSYDLLKSTGIPTLDSAITTTIVNSNPVPRVPRSFEPETPRFAFTIRIGFRLEQE